MKPKLLTHGLAFIAMCMMAIAPMKAEDMKAALVSGMENQSCTASSYLTDPC